MYAVDQGSLYSPQLRFVILERRNLQAAGASVSLSSTGAVVVSSSSNAEGDLEDSDSSSGLSDEDLPDADSNRFSDAGFSTTTPGSNFASQTASALATPDSYMSMHDVKSNAASQAFPFTGGELTASLHTGHDFSLGALPASSTFLEPSGSVPSVDRALDLGSLWSMTNFSSPPHRGGSTMTGVERSQSGRKNTLTIEDVEPRMVTKIINILYESEAAVKVNISSQH